MKLSEDNRLKANNIKGLFSNPQTKPIIIITGALLVGMIGIAIFKQGRTADEDVPAAASVNGAPAVEHQPGVNDSPAHTVLQQQANAKQIEQAKAHAQTSLPTLTSNQDINQPILLPPGPQQTPAPTTPAQPTLQFQAPVQQQLIQQPVIATPVTNVAQQPAQQPVKQEVSHDIQKRIEDYLNYWGPKDVLFQEYTVTNQQEKQWEAPKEVAQDAASTAQVSLASAQAENKVRFVRAGTTVPGVLITPLNSDAPGPVLAEISSGPLAGARLIGTMKVAKNSLLVTFSTISKPGWPDTYSVKAVGMSVDKSTALASDVNNHYVQKYFGMLGGSFLTGYGDAMQQVGSVTYLDPTSGGVVSQSSELDAGQISQSAQGNVLSEVGKDWQRQAQSVTPTVKVQGKDGASYPIQILFLGNF